MATCCLLLQHQACSSSIHRLLIASLRVLQTKEYIVGTFELLKEIPQDIKGLPQNVSRPSLLPSFIVMGITGCRHITSPQT